MAIILNKPKKDQMVGQPSQPQTTGPAFTGMGGGQPSTQQQSTSPRFTNLKQFLGANVGAGEKLASNVLQQKGQLETGLTKAKTEAEDVKTKAAEETGRIKTSGELAAEDIAKTGGQGITAPAPQPTLPTLEQFQNLYSGKSGYEDYLKKAQEATVQAATKAQELGRFGEQLGTESGRQALLGGTMSKKGTYGQGLSVLDQALLQRSGGQQQLGSAIKDIRTKLPGEQKTISGLQESLLGQDKDKNVLFKLSDQASTTKGRLGEVLGGEQKKFLTEQEEEARDLSTKNFQMNEALKAFFGGQTLNSDQQKVLESELQKGQLTPGMRTYNVLAGDKYRKYIQEGKSDLKAEDVITEQDLARYKALETLAGTSADKLRFSKASDPSAAAALKSQELLADISARQKEFEDLSKSTKAKYDTQFTAPSGLVSSEFAEDTMENLLTGGIDTKKYNTFANQIEAGANNIINTLANQTPDGFGRVKTLWDLVNSGQADLVGYSPEEIDKIKYRQLSPTEEQALVKQVASRNAAPYRQQMETNLKDQLENYLREQGYYETLGPVMERDFTLT